MGAGTRGDMLVWNQRARRSVSFGGRPLHLILAKRPRRDGLLGNRKSGRDCVGVAGSALSLQQ